MVNVGIQFRIRYKAAFTRATFSCENRHFAFFSFSNRVGHLHGARFTCDFVCAISPDTPPKKSSRSSYSHGRDFDATLAYDCNSQKSLTRRDYVPVILAKSSRRKSCHRTGSLTQYEIVSKRGLLVLNLQKLTAAKELKTHRFLVRKLKPEFW